MTPPIIVFHRDPDVLAGAVRRAERVAIAMESRGFTGAGPRTYYTAVPIGRKDWLLGCADKDLEPCDRCREGNDQVCERWLEGGASGYGFVFDARYGGGASPPRMAGARTRRRCAWQVSRVSKVSAPPALRPLRKELRLTRCVESKVVRASSIRPGCASSPATSIASGPRSIGSCRA